MTESTVDVSTEQVIGITGKWVKSLTRLSWVRVRGYARVLFARSQLHHPGPYLLWLRSPSSRSLRQLPAPPPWPLGRLRSSFSRSLRIPRSIALILLSPAASTSAVASSVPLMVLLVLFLPVLFILVMASPGCAPTVFPGCYRQLADTARNVKPSNQSSPRSPVPGVDSVWFNLLADLLRVQSRNFASSPPLEGPPSSGTYLLWASHDKKGLQGGRQGHKIAEPSLCWGT